MTNALRLGLLALFMTKYPTSAWAEVALPMAFALTSVSDDARYGLLIATPDQVVCQSVQFIVRGENGVVGRSQPLHPGEVQVVRIGAGYPAGVHALTIAVSGCPVQPAVVRRVRLNKTSPDHGWRAVAFLQASFTP